MKRMAFLNLAAVALLIAGAVVMLMPESAHAAPLLDNADGLRDALSNLNLADAVGLVALREKASALKEKARRKLEEIRDDMTADQVRSIEDEHAAILRELEAVNEEIASAEADDERRDMPAGGARNGSAGGLTGAQAAEIMEIGNRAGMAHDDIVAAVRSGESVEDFRVRAFDHLAEQSRRNPTAPARIIRDEDETRRDALTEALSYRLGAPMPENGPTEPAREFMQFRRFSSFIAEAIGYEGRIDSVRSIDDLFDRAAHSTGDFPAIYEGAVNRALEARYALAEPTYRRIARRSDFRDFRPHKTVKIGDFPMLAKVAENGEIKHGTFGEGAEQIQAFSYARAISVSRQMIINDDLGAIAEILASYGDTVALFEEVMFYAEALEGKLSDNKAVYHADHNNIGTAAAITVDSVALGKASMSKQKSLNGYPLLENKPHIILCGPDKITEAEKLVASITPATMSNVNIFSGRLTPIETAQISSKAWYLLPDASSRWSNYRYGMLEGYEAPRVRMDEPFGRQGFSMSVEHDFGVGATDYRFGYKNPGN
ncbi:hypothetical protein [Oricola thermophila]|uniref:Bacteriophage Mu GpT domain-containing protein n=1 Tax=Oricola thermophila TaxID=2742145 RepID=A0A6N1VHH9_9HYPH|nr:hypothetical protein [Oricola thermophila]QKV20248.1 hypothetical protein HTY61_18215 [Oricola thermophila]